MKTSEKIKELRIALGMSQDELGRKVGLQRAAINKYETGRVVNIKKSMLVKLADALKVSPAYLLDDDSATNTYYNSLLMSSYENHADVEKLVKLYLELNADGKAKLLDYASDLVASGRYIKSDIISKEA